jgi:hypothetical protein
LRNSDSDHVRDATRLDRDVRRILRDRVRQKLPRQIKDAAALDRIALLIEGAVPAQTKRSRKAA